MGFNPLRRSIRSNALWRSLAILPPLAAVLCIAFGQFTHAADSKDTLIDPAADHDKLIDDLQSGDDSRVTGALDDIRAYIKRHGSYRPEAAACKLLIDGKRYADLESIAMAQILKSPGYTLGVATLEKLRAQAFIAAGDGASAASAAKAYYNVAPLKDTAAAVDLVALCLSAAHPDDPAIVQRFKQQQVAWATAAPAPAPATQPSANGTDVVVADAAEAGTGAGPINPAAADSDLGTPILPTIPLDPKPFDAAITAIALTDYNEFLAKGNLLLISGRSAEARELFQKAVAIAPIAKSGEACENVARAIRAESGCIAPANAYILSVQSKNVTGGNGGGK